MVSTKVHSTDCRTKLLKIKRKKIIVLFSLILLAILIIIRSFQATIYGDYDTYLCDTAMKSTYQSMSCPKEPIVTVQKTGRLGNQMWEYASVWSVAKTTGREPYVPSCLVQELQQVFVNLSLPTLSSIANCPLKRSLLTPPQHLWKSLDADLLLPEYAQLPSYVVPFLGDVLKLFQFKRHLIEESHRFLHKHSKYKEDTVFVGVHVRRGDYIKVLPAVWKKNVVTSKYFLTIMEYFEKKYKTTVFIVMSDDTDWCEKELQTGRDDVIVRTNSSPGEDLAVMAACNHSILDYGTFGMWGAAMAGGETFLYNLTWGLEYKMSHLMKNWHLVN